ncbi:MAG: hypothetical protein AB1499_09030 [Nitrospirota bacterium]
MAQIEFEDFENKEIERVFMAGNQEEAMRVEELLNDEEIDYAIALEPFTTVMGLIMPTSQKQGITFYVIAGQSDYCRNIFKSNGLKAGIINDD